MQLLNTIRSFFLRRSLSDLPPEDVAQSIIAGIGQRADAERLSEALQVRLANRAPPTMYAEQVVDTLADADPRQRLSYQVSPFSRMTAGAATVVIASNADGEEYILLGMKGGGKRWDIPAGFMNTVASANPLGVFSENIEPVRDDYERTLMKNRSYASGVPINRLTTALPEFDRSPEDTAIRETREEAGLALRKDQLTHVAHFMETSPGGALSRQGECHLYLADLRKEKTLPGAAQGDDLENPQWVKLSDLTHSFIDGQKMLTYQGKPVAAEERIEKAITLMRDKEYAAYGVTREAISQFSHLPSPDSSFGPTAHAWHRNALTIAESMQSTLNKMQDKHPEPSSHPGMAV